MAGIARSRFQIGADYIVCRQVLAAQRRAGADFATAWELALKMVGKEDRGILQETKHAWACAYARESFYSGASFGRLADVIDGDTESRITGQLVM